MKSWQPIRALTEFRERHEPPLSQEGLAQMVGVSRVAVNRWERGERRIDDDKVPTVSEVTGIPPHVLRPDLARILGTEVAA